LKLVNSLLDFSRIEAGKVRVSFEPIDLGALTAELASNFRSATEQARLALSIDCPAGLEPVYADRDMWEKIVLNLMSNAFKFTFEGSIAVAYEHLGNCAQLTVRDTGTGIPTAELPRLFERFHRIEGALGRSFEGSGIGLALVKELVEAQGGSIRAESEEGRGSTFFVTLPLGSSHVQAEQIRSAEAPGVATPGAAAPGAMRGTAQVFANEAQRWLPTKIQENVPDGDDAVDGANGVRRAVKARILLADDNADMRDYVSRLLGEKHECLTAGDGQEALERLRSQRPDLLLTDVMMPRLDGFALIKAVREDPVLRDLPIIVISARAGEESSVEGLATGADDYLVKPFTQRELIARVDGALAMSRVRRDMGDALRDEARSLELLNQVGTAVAAELELHRAVQVVNDAATELTGAAFGSFFYKVFDDRGEHYMLDSLTIPLQRGVARSPAPHEFIPFAASGGIVRIDDLLQEPSGGVSYQSMLQGHPPIRSYLAAPVVSRAGEVLGALCFGHPQPHAFTARSERLLLGIVAQAAIALDNARLYQSLEAIVAARTREL